MSFTHFEEKESNFRKSTFSCFDPFECFEGKEKPCTTSHNFLGSVITSVTKGTTKSNPLRWCLYSSGAPRIPVAFRGSTRVPTKFRSIFSPFVRPNVLYHDTPSGCEAGVSQSGGGSRVSAIQGNKVGLHIPKLLLPKTEYREAWPVVACDQFTSEPEYWKNVSDIVGDKPSALNVILPDMFLGTPEEPKLIEEKIANMKSYLEKGIFEEKTALVYLERSTKNVKLRRGLVIALDLETYSFKKGDTALIRPTEQTVAEMIPPRLKVRSRAIIESPHIVMLINDALCSVIEPLTEKKDKLGVLYDQELMLDAGHIKGYAVEGADADRVVQSLTALLNLNPNEGAANPSPFLYAVGDGNHSLAAAKQAWENIKQTYASKTTDEQQRKTLLNTHPARYCLVELCNIHDDGVQFEAVHRVLFNTSASASASLLGALEKKYGAEGFEKKKAQSYDVLKWSVNAAAARAASGRSVAHHVGVIEGGGFYDVSLPQNLHKLPLGAIQQFLDSPDYKPMFDKMDYIHGDGAMLRLSMQAGNTGVLLPRLPKTALFPAVEGGGILPRKTFSMGDTDEKRFYFECRKIVE